MNLVIIKYNAGNIQSVKYALTRLGIEANITDNADEIKGADKVIFPGVGEARSAMEYLQSTGLDIIIPQLTQPFLGICLGMQLMCAFSEERNTKCLGIFKETVKQFPPHQKVPHMGWNTISNLKSKLFNQINENNYVYFVHSYYVEPSVNTIAYCNYITNFSAALQKNNFYGVQFHPEKSGETGTIILKNFIDL